MPNLNETGLPSAQEIAILKQNGKDFTVIRKELREAGLKKEVIDALCSEADRIITDEFRGKQHSSAMRRRKLGKKAMVFGLIIALTAMLGGGIIKTFLIWLGPAISASGTYLFLSGREGRFRRKFE